MGNYYYLMAGLPDLKMSDAKPACSITSLREECEEMLSPKDKQLLYYYFLRWDCVNIVRLLKDPEAQIELFGNFTMEQYQDLLTSARELTFNVHRYPSFLSVFVREYAFNKDKKGFFAEDVMMYEYLQYVMKNCSNRMMVKCQLKAMFQIHQQLIKPQKTTLIPLMEKIIGLSMIQVQILLK